MSNLYETELQVNAEKLTLAFVFQYTWIRVADGGSIIMYCSSPVPRFACLFPATNITLTAEQESTDRLEQN